MSEEKGLVVSSYSVQAIKDQMDQVHNLMKTVMKEDEHFGIIPGTKKRSLYKQGAEKLSMMFRLAPKYEITTTDLGEGHREITVSCVIIHIPTQVVVAEGVGSCSTMESKFRYRNISGFEVTEESIPEDAKENKAAYWKKGYGMQKVDDQWRWVKYKPGEKQENPDIADVYNTVLKMAKKRAHIDGILTATAASDIFTQDYEPDEEQPPPPPPIDYETEQQATAFLKSCNTLDDLEKACVQYKSDHSQGKTGWPSDVWKRVAGVMGEVKERLENRPGGNNQQSEQTYLNKLIDISGNQENQEKINYLLQEGIIEKSDLDTQDEETAKKTYNLIVSTKMETEDQAPYGLDED
jgi:hypothetical protein